jgi:YYY domain-containing protein
LGFTALILGGLSFLNTWDVLIHLFVILGAFVLGRWREDGRWNRQFWLQAAALGAILIIPAALLSLPFYFGFRSQAGAPFLLPMTMRPTRLLHFLVIFGLPLSTLTIFMGALTVRALRNGRSATSEKSPWPTALLSVSGLILALFLLMLLLGVVIGSNSEGASRIINLASELETTLPPYPEAATFISALGWSFGAIIKLIPDFVKVRFQFPALTLYLGAILVAIIGLLSRHLQKTAGSDTELQQEPAPTSPSALPFVLLLIGTATLLTLGPEFVYLKDVFSQRLNTIFKFYYQAWLLFGVTAAFGLSYLWNRFRVAGAAAAVIYGGALAAALLFPVFAAQSRSVEYRGSVENEERLPATLNGLAYIDRFNTDEYEALMWLRQNVNGQAVILEAVGGAYTGYARVSADTGIPTVLGWPGHERQWRGTTPEPGIREPAVSTIYSLASWPETADILDRYNVTHVYFGRLERETYDPQAEEKFDQNLEIAYQNSSVKIYRWQPQ